ncbi:MAG: serine/threonine protein kinase, partial [Deltaproteobacteria bacterium HGW-Deltaproteobacteria-14]
MSQPDTFTGRIIAGKYAIKERIGAGGMGAVYRALHQQTGGDVAVKVLHGTAALDDHAVKRFQLEAQNAAQLRHANTIRVIDFGIDEGVFYLVMEHLVGHALNDLIARQGPFPWRRAVHITRQVLASLWEAHEHPRIIIHRDIKPANIFVLDQAGTRDHVKVLDFGIARSLAGTGAGTQGFIGTPYYMAPELWKGELVDARTDLYALGCVVFEMLAGAPPFVPPPSATEVLLPLLGMHCHDAPPRTVDAVAGIPPGLAAWVDRLLKKDRAERPPSAREALEELDRLAREADLGAAAREHARPPRVALQQDAAAPAPPPAPAAAVAPTEVAALEPGPAVT